MPYIAHIGIVLGENYTSYVKDQWELILQCDGLRYHRRVNSDNLYEIACELFYDKESALLAAKNIYIQAIYNLLRNHISIVDGGCQMYEKRFHCEKYDGDDFPDWFFFWTPKNQGGGIGPDVYEVDNSFDEFDEIYKHINMKIGWEVSVNDMALNFSNYERAPFLYSKESQPFINTILQANSSFDHGLKMTLFCGIIEHIANIVYKDINRKYKDEDVLLVIDNLIKDVDESALTKEKKASLVQYLTIGKNKSSRKKCRDICYLYAKESYGQFRTNDIIDDAYNTRSTFSHGGNRHNTYSGPSSLMVQVVLDVVEGYMNDSSVDHNTDAQN